jgi:hypothetical protein
MNAEAAQMNVRQHRVGIRGYVERSHEYPVALGVRSSALHLRSSAFIELPKR